MVCEWSLIGFHYIEEDGH